MCGGGLKLIFTYADDMVVLSAISVGIREEIRTLITHCEKENVTVKF